MSPPPPEAGAADGPRRIRAAVTRTFGAPPTVEDVLLRGPGVDEVGVRVVACAICHSDISYASGAWGGSLPAVFGHEAAGIVEEIGPGVVGVRPGDHVVVTLIRSCGRCAGCLRGQPALCEQMGALPTSVDPPLTTLEGRPVMQGLRVAGFAERVTVHASQVVPVPRKLPLESACLIGCGVLTGVGAVLTTAQAEPGSTVGVIGVGGVGMNAVQGAVIAGARLVVAIDVRASKLEAARAFGATHALDARDDVAEQVAALTGGRGLDHVIVTASSAAAVEQALGLVGAAGRVVLVGMPPGARATIDPETIAERAIAVLGSKVGGARPQLDVPRLAALYLGGRLRLDELVSGRYPLDHIEEALAAASAGEAVRCVVVP